MSAEFSFPLPEEIIEKLNQIDERLQKLEGDKIQTHKIGLPSALSVNFEGHHP